MNITPISFKAKFTIPYNEANKKIEYLHPKVVNIGKKIQATTTVTNDKITIDSYKSKDALVRRVLKKMGIEFKEESKQQTALENNYFMVK